jgi:hypothetical protein
MDRRGANTWIVAVLAIAVGFLAALLIFKGDDSNNTSATVGSTNTTTLAGTTTSGTTTSGTSTTTTTATQQGAAPQSPQATIPSCVDLWNQTNNRANQVFLVNVMSQQPVRVHVGTTSDVPPQCLVTVVANDGKAYVFPEGGGSTFPYAASPASTDSASLPPAQKTSNALEQRDGTLTAR